MTSELWYTGCITVATALWWEKQATRDLFYDHLLQLLPGNSMSAGGGTSLGRTGTLPGLLVVCCPGWALPLH